MSYVRAEELIRLRNIVLDVMAALDDHVLVEYSRRSREAQGLDGYPPGAGTGPSGGEVVRPTESVVVARLTQRPQPDPQMAAIEQILRSLRAMARDAEVARRSHDLVQHITAQRRGRETSISECLCCARPVSGVGDDRLRAGLCDSCRKAWERDGRPDRGPWLIQRRAQLEADVRAS